MHDGTHRCAVDGCPNRAAFEVMHYAFDTAEGAVVFREDEDYPYICVEHALDNEREARGERRPGGVAVYPYTNRGRAPGLSLYLQLEPSYAR